MCSTLHLLYIEDEVRRKTSRRSRVIALNRFPNPTHHFWEHNYSPLQYLPSFKMLDLLYTGDSPHPPVLPWTAARAARPQCRRSLVIKSVTLKGWSMPYALIPLQVTSKATVTGSLPSHTGKANVVCALPVFSPQILEAS